MLPSREIIREVLNRQFTEAKEIKVKGVVRSVPSIKKKVGLIYPIADNVYVVEVTTSTATGKAVNLPPPPSSHLPSGKEAEYKTQHELQCLQVLPPTSAATEVWSIKGLCAPLVLKGLYKVFGISRSCIAVVTIDERSNSARIVLYDANFTGGFRQLSETLLDTPCPEEVVLYPILQSNLFLLRTGHVDPFLATLHLCHFNGTRFGVVKTITNELACGIHSTEPHPPIEISSEGIVTFLMYKRNSGNIEKVDGMFDLGSYWSGVVSDAAHGAITKRQGMSKWEREYMMTVLPHLMMTGIIGAYPEGQTGYPVVLIKLMIDFLGSLSLPFDCHAPLVRDYPTVKSAPDIKAIIKRIDMLHKDSFLIAEEKAEIAPVLFQLKKKMLSRGDKTYSEIVREVEALTELDIKPVFKKAYHLFGQLIEVVPAGRSKACQIIRGILRDLEEHDQRCYSSRMIAYS